MCGKGRRGEPYILPNSRKKPEMLCDIGVLFGHCTHSRILGEYLVTDLESRPPRESFVCYKLVGGRLSKSVVFSTLICDDENTREIPIGMSTIAYSRF